MCLGRWMAAYPWDCMHPAAALLQVAACGVGPTAAVVHEMGAQLAQDVARHLGTEFTVSAGCQGLPALPGHLWVRPCSAVLHAMPYMP